MRIGVICDAGQIAEWQRRALANIPGSEFVVLSCVNSRTPRPSLRHAAYRVIASLSMPAALTRLVPLPAPGVEVSERLEFESDWRAGRQALPDAVVDWIASRHIDAIVKFGMPEFLVPEGSKLAAPVLAFTHADPRRYGGGPPGFYELLDGDRNLVQVVQVLSSERDAGRILASAETRLTPHSWKASLVDAYGHSPWVLRKALQSLSSGERLEVAPTTQTPDFPGNGTALRFITQRVVAAARRLAYGAVVEKEWRVSTAPMPSGASLFEGMGSVAQVQREWRTLSADGRHSFFADPFYHGDDGTVLVEAMVRRTGRGELLRISGDSRTRLEGTTGHSSYPSSVTEGGETFVVPEVAGWTTPIIYRLSGAKLEKVADLDTGGERLIDPTIFRHRNRLYLFGNRLGDGSSVLGLWTARSLFDRFEPHPQSPIRISARGSRMAGEIFKRDGALYRFGQDFVHGYGDGVLVFRIRVLTRTRYEEEHVGTFAFDGAVRGPHTLSFRGGEALFDWYVERISPLAGFRRWLGRRAVKEQSRDSESAPAAAS